MPIPSLGAVQADVNVIGSPDIGANVLFSVAGSRVLAYQAQTLEQLVWVDRTGTMKEKVRKIRML